MQLELTAKQSTAFNIAIDRSHSVVVFGGAIRF